MTVPKYNLRFVMTTHRSIFRTIWFEDQLSFYHLDKKVKLGPVFQFPILPNTTVTL